MMQEQAVLWILAFSLLAMLGVFQWFGKLPSTTSLHELSLVMNSRGGNILVLALMSMLFFFSGTRMIYWCIDMVAADKLKPDNAIVMLGLTFVTGSAFGGSFGALLKTMTGEDKQEAVTKVEKVESVTKTEQPKE